MIIPTPEEADQVTSEIIEEQNKSGLAATLVEDIRKHRNLDSGAALDEHEILRRARALIDVVASQSDRVPMVLKLMSCCLDEMSVVELENILNEHVGSRPIKTRIIDAIRTDRVPSDYQQMTLAEYKATKILEITRLDGAALREPTVYLFLGRLIRAALRRARARTEDNGFRYKAILSTIADITKFFWEMALSWTTNPVMNDAQDDYVSSTMEDGQCIYFSNFVPTGSEMFTRTVFVDLGLSPHERGRILQRLCDILTYRAMAIRDIDRAQLAINCLYELNRELNSVQSALATQDKFMIALTPSADGPSENQAGFLSCQLAKIQDIAARAGYINSFFTYGIVGRYSSSAAYLQQILERCVDVQEMAIPGYPSLRGFVERRLAHSIRNYERMNMHYVTVERRITELMGMIRTQLDTLQAQEVTKNLEQQTKAGIVLTQASNRLTRATDKIGENLGRQLSLQEAAEAIVIIGGTYYGYGLLKVGLGNHDGVDQLSGWTLVLISFVLCLVARLAAVPAVMYVMRGAARHMRRWRVGPSTPEEGSATGGASEESKLGSER